MEYSLHLLKYIIEYVLYMHVSISHAYYYKYVMVFIIHGIHVRITILIVLQHSPPPQKCLDLELRRMDIQINASIYGLHSQKYNVLFATLYLQGNMRNVH